MRHEAFQHYGCKCIQCGQSEENLLTLHADGYVTELDLPFSRYKQLQAESWPAGYYTLCVSCSSTSLYTTEG